ncbi:hypothetical protein G5I_09888 [Acromyrmex echinatior]|uniref:Uncharacterized protein n=1 Tax=Acromyrmex echinatior TaxID=103372 RepID=F4WVF0_ACREC|nr:hypothetical protein G5I_09888 [Acromyrmex echinatior]
MIGLRVRNAQGTVQKWDDREGSQRPEAKPDICEKEGRGREGAEIGNAKVSFTHEALQSGSRVKFCWKVVDAKLPRSSEAEAEIEGLVGSVTSYRSVGWSTPPSLPPLPPPPPPPPTTVSRGRKRNVCGPTRTNAPTRTHATRRN